MKFDISEKQEATSKPAKMKVKANEQELSKIYREIQATSDNLKVRFEK